ncbi:hypothetical protein BHE90_016209 [Fusarium euwallaceae]|uniref:Uncharacterized protein n=3 Tax=Fusarium solani species complex TaxID=232080 RepID=A0A428UBA2_9HYPO|nr:hypothetical protein CDV31_013289 [Fusarium ambrosium]RSM11504.1 hypothetical protein CEP52_003070 [Fusarium oligoseptatum]RTE69410.1 hypothetical protein BHE90_016209 [Fusarium euwallaceae]
MSSDEATNNFVFSNDEDRPHVNHPDTIPPFFVGDKVKVLLSDGSTEGPYLVASVIPPDRCTLCHPGNHKKAKDGAVIEMAVLEAA